jgi:hypothetical protein
MPIEIDISFLFFPEIIQNKSSIIGRLTFLIKNKNKAIS